MTSTVLADTPPTWPIFLEWLTYVRDPVVILHEYGRGLTRGRPGIHVIKKVLDHLDNVAGGKSYDPQWLDTVAKDLDTCDTSDGTIDVALLEQLSRFFGKTHSWVVRKFVLCLADGFDLRKTIARVGDAFAWDLLQHSKGIRTVADKKTETASPEGKNSDASSKLTDVSDTTSPVLGPSGTMDKDGNLILVVSDKYRQALHHENRCLVLRHDMDRTGSKWEHCWTLEKSAVPTGIFYTELAKFTDKNE